MTTSSQPIRVAIIGLAPTRGWAYFAHLPYLTSPSNDKFRITAVCNSSVASAQRAIEHHKLPAETKAYGSTEELAQDDNVDLIVCTTRVDTHHNALLPILRAAKPKIIYAEWPLAASHAEASELLALSSSRNITTAVGLQGRHSPIGKKIQEVISSGKIGKVLSSTFRSFGGNLGEKETDKLKYLGQREVGGNLITIHAGHAIDSLMWALGGRFQSPAQSLFANTRPNVPIFSPETNEIVDKDFIKDTPDTIFVQGTLTTGVPVSFTLRGGKPFKGTPAMDWRIYGEKGELRITASGMFLNLDYDDWKIEIHNFETDEVEIVEIDKDEVDQMEGLGLMSRNVGRVYESIAAGKINCTFEDAVEHHKFLEDLWKNSGLDG